MSRFAPAGAGVDLLPAPAIVPDRPARDVEGELVDLLCDDEAWLDETFREIVATGWAEPPRGGAARQSGRPRRSPHPAVRAPQHDGGGRSQWCPNPYRRQRSPPAVS